MVSSELQVDVFVKTALDKISKHALSLGDESSAEK